ncbi:MAG: hypothetical protein JNG88_16580, partial [Phycisphaerales bacterium]|nr:hypothetical protein [Phycisphaerales bacterium]
PILDAGQIHAILEDLLVDFPFRTPANRDNAVGMLLTPVVQPAIAGNIPMHPVVAPLERTGKTKLACDLMGHIFKGVSIAPVQFPPNEEEIEKRILAELLRDGGFVVLDNIRTVVDSPALASLLTSRLFTGRLLGKSLMVTLPNNLIVLGTGNNIITSGEIAKRSIPIHLQPPNDHPEDRVDFKHPDLFEYLASVRSVVLGALLGAVELWIAAGRPPHPNRCRLGGFEEWSDVVGGVLHGVGFTEWRANERNWRRAADPRGEDLKAFVLEWWNRFGMTPMPARDLSWVARELGLFLDCFARASEHAQTQAFVAKALTCNIDRPVEEFVIRRDNYGSSSRYYLDKVT